MLKIYFFVIVLFLLTVGSTSYAVPASIYLPVSSHRLPKEAASPFDVQLIESEILCISCLEPNGLVFVSRSDLKKIKWIPMAASPSFLKFNSVNSELYALSFEQPTIWIFDAKKLSLSRLIRLPKGAHAVQMCVSKDGKTAFVGDGSKPVVYVVDLEKGEVSKQIILSAPAQRLLFDESSSNLYVGLQALEEKRQTKNLIPRGENLNARVDVISMVNLQLVETVSLPGAGVAGLSVDGEKHLFVLSYREALLSRVEIGAHLKPSDQPSVQMPGDRSVNGLGLIYDDKNRALYVQSEGLNANWTSIVDPISLRVINRVVGGNGNLILKQERDSENAMIYAPNSYNGSLTTIDVSSLFNVPQQ